MSPDSFMICLSTINDDERHIDKIGGFVRQGQPSLQTFISRRFFEQPENKNG